MTIGLMAVIFSCSPAKKTAAGGKNAPPKIGSITMMRGACFGRCSVYDIRIEPNGMATYTGKMFTPDSGVYQKNIGVAKTGEIIRMAADNRIDTCSETYDLLIADLPGVRYEIEIDGKTKVINNAHFGPVFLKKLTTLINSYVKVDRTWTRIGEYTPPN